MSGLLDSGDEIRASRLGGLLADPATAFNQTGLLNFLQSASNSAASNVSAPVDGIAWLLRKAGLPIPAAPVGGSDWMEQRGLTRPVQQNAASLAGETMGMLAPIGAAAKAPQIARGLLSLDDKAMDMARRGIESRMVNGGMIQPATVWHGSPHKFDKFDASKIGTGEGAQAYSHGLYFAESPDVAKSYQAMDGAFDYVPTSPAAAEQIKKATNFADRAVVGLRDALDTHGGDVGKAAKSLRIYANQATSQEYKDAYEKLAALAEGGGISSKPAGFLYKVDLPDNAIAKMLYWDKRLSEQNSPALKNWFDSQKSFPGGYSYAEHSGKTLYEALRGRGLSADQASEQLKQIGIPGIRYLDGGSRGAGQGSSNFVIFPGNEGLLQILERNGAPIK